MIRIEVGVATDRRMILPSASLLVPLNAHFRPAGPLRDLVPAKSLDLSKAIAPLKVRDLVKPTDQEIVPVEVS
jgi:hypothetical protein